MNEQPIPTPGEAPVSAPPCDMSEGAFHLGDWLVRPTLNRLQSGDTSLHLEPRLVNLLVFFARHPRTVLTKEQLFDSIWQTRYVADSALTRSVAELRRALGDDAHQPRYIETIPKRGYRLVAPVAPAAGNGSHPEAVRVIPPRKLDRRQIVTWIAAAALTVIGLVLTTLALTGFDLDPAPETSPAPRVRSVAVLPFQDLSDPPLDVNFTTAVIDALTNDLAQLNTVRVVSRRAVEQVQQVRGQQVSLDQIARRLGVDAVVEGSLLRQDGQVRITLQLTEAATASHLWAGSYEAELGQVLALQEQAAAEIARAVER